MRAAAGESYFLDLWGDNRSIPARCAEATGRVAGGAQHKSARIAFFLDQLDDLFRLLPFPDNLLGYDADRLVPFVLATQKQSQS